MKRQRPAIVARNVVIQPRHYPVNNSLTVGYSGREDPELSQTHRSPPPTSVFEVRPKRVTRNFPGLFRSENDFFKGHTFGSHLGAHFESLSFWVEGGGWVGQGTGGLTRGVLSRKFLKSGLFVSIWGRVGASGKGAEVPHVSRTFTHGLLRFKSHALPMPPPHALSVLFRTITS